MQKPQNSFEILPDLAAKMPRISNRWIWGWKIFYGLKAAWRHFRVTSVVTRILGPQYRRSRDMIEIDITYACNLHCINCNRSVTQAPDINHMPLEMIQAFVRESMERGKKWRRIRVLGGEPTMHPEFRSIVEELRLYLDWHRDCILEVVSNGYGKVVIAQLESLPSDVMVDNSNKTSQIQPYFGPFNMAPADDVRYAFADYKNGCAVMEDCGMGLTPTGYYPCAVAGGVDRLSGGKLGARRLPDDDDDMLPALQPGCRLCGRFRDGHFVPRILRPKLEEECISKSWAGLYDEWREKRRRQAL